MPSCPATQLKPVCHHAWTGQQLRHHCISAALGSQTSQCQAGMTAGFIHHDIDVYTNTISEVRSQPSPCKVTSYLQTDILFIINISMMSQQGQRHLAKSDCTFSTGRNRTLHCHHLVISCVKWSLQTCSSLPASLCEARLLRRSRRASLERQAHCRRTSLRRYSRKALRAWYLLQLRCMHRAALCCLHTTSHLCHGCLYLGFMV